MKFISRDAQAGKMVGYSIFSALPEKGVPTSDEYFDGLPIGSKSIALNWVEENDVHRALTLSGKIESNRYFLGAQMLAVRDEVRNKTHVAVPDASGVAIATLRNGEVLSREGIYSGYTKRAHISLQKKDGAVFVLHCSGTQQEQRVYLNKEEIQSECRNPDFPFMDISQPPIGHAATEVPEFSLISYKCRTSGEIYLRKITNGSIGEERKLDTPPTVGGVDFAITENEVIFRINALQDGAVVPMMATSKDNAESISPFEPLDLSETPFKEFLPANTPVQIDHLGNHHIPVDAVDDENYHLLDYIPEHQVTDAIAVKRDLRNHPLLMPFPKKPGMVAENLGVGDGLTDGLGVIATAISSGKIFSSNSQSGGTSYPDAVLLNYEMQRVYALKATPCYTRGKRPNMVSMDYLFIEADDEGSAISTNLFFETWDMPLPQPLSKATSSGPVIELEIVRDAFFYPGGCTFRIVDSPIQVIDVKIESERKAVITCDSEELKGEVIEFESKNTFYSHMGEAVVE
ncbi:MAG: hypothetical protein JAY84_08955 [Candidatus Thiodiazotropha taylori]|nr:hypothetical protein [Candidatus Thiodiazotropha taylori]